MKLEAETSGTQARQRWMGILARAEPQELEACWQRLKQTGNLPAYQILRHPEIGLTLLRGRVGGDGAPFNVGEMTVTRCSIRTESGVVGHAWIAGRRLIQAEQAAVIDALLQETPQLLQETPQQPPDHGSLADDLARLDLAFRERRLARSRKAAATRVDFFTLVRGAT